MFDRALYLALILCLCGCSGGPSDARPDGGSPPPSDGSTSGEDAGRDTDSATPPLAEEVAYEVRLQIEFEDWPRSFLGAPPTEAGATLYLRPGTDGGHMVLGSPERLAVSESSAAIDVDGQWQASEELSLATGAEYCDPIERSYRIESLSVRPRPDGVDGQASGQLRVYYEDLEADVPFTATIAGELDRRGPEVAGPTEPQHPLDLVQLGLSEPVPADLEARLVADSETAEPWVLAGIPRSGIALAGWTTAYPVTRALPFGSRLAVELNAELRDLIGNPGSLSTEVQTMAGPTTDADGTFETHESGILGSAVVVRGVGDMPAIQGDRSLLVMPLERATLRLPLSPTSRELVFSYQVLSEGFPISFEAQLSLFQDGGAVESESQVFELGEAIPVTGGGRWVRASMVGQHSIRVPEALRGSASSILFDVRNATADCGLRGRAALLIDEVRVQD